MKFNLLRSIKVALSRVYFNLGNIYITVSCNDTIKTEFSIGPFLTYGSAKSYSNVYAKNLNKLKLEFTISKTNKAGIPTFKANKIKHLAFKQHLQDLHIKNYLLGQSLQMLSGKGSVVDVGANTGLYTTAFARSALKVFSFECSHPVLNVLKNTVSDYGNISIIQKAVSSTTGDIQFYIDQNRFSNSGIIQQVKSQEISVACTTLDDAIKRDDIELVKIDTEGSEFEVLKGMVNIISSSRPLIFIECWGKQSNYKHKDIFNYLKSHAYNCYANLKDAGLVQIIDVQTFENISCSYKYSSITDGDYLFVPIEKCP